MIEWPIGVHDFGVLRFVLIAWHVAAGLFELVLWYMGYLSGWRVQIHVLEVY